MYTRTLLFSLFITVAFASSAIGQALFFSEYIEGSSNNKGLEIYNPTDSTVSLDSYQILQTSNGSDTTVWEFFHIFPAEASIAAGDVWVITNDAADQLMQAAADEILAFPSVVHHNGDDARALAMIVGTDTTLIDVIGVTGPDPGDGWDVAGVTDGTKEHTLVRKSTVTTGNTVWASSAGTNADDSEWEVYDQDTFNYFGTHPGTMINVTFRVNSSTIEGMTDSLGVVDLRGTVTQWGPGTDMTNVGGDYWETTLRLVAGTAYDYKYGGSLTDIQGLTTLYWENDFTGADYSPGGANRTLTTGSSDTVLALDWLGRGPDNLPRYTETDSVDLYFRLNMGEVAGFDPASDILSLVGHFPIPSHDGQMWGNGAGTYVLSRESETSNYWGINVKIAQAYMDTVENILFDAGWPEDAHGLHMYRFGIGTGWNQTENLGGKYFPNNENRVLYLKNMSSDTTLAWKWWNDEPEQLAGSDSVDVHFFADLSRAVSENGFSLDDTLTVKWGYNNTGSFDEAQMVNIALTNNYEVTVNAKNVALGADLNYQYHKTVNGAEFEEVFFDFDETEAGSAQRSRKVFIAASPVEPVLTEDNVVSNSDLHRQPRFRNTSSLAQPVMVTFSVDLRPAYYTVLGGVTINDIQGAIDVTNADDVFTLGVAINGPATVGSWSEWGASLLANVNKVMHDDGASGGDMVAGDSIYSMQVLHSPDSSSRNVIGTEFKFGLGGGDNEVGADFGFGLNHIENIDDSQSEFTIHSQFGSINPNYYTGWDYDNVTGLGDIGEILYSNELMGNYPNPFNPATKIRFNLFRQADVKLVIYDITGKEVRTLLNGPQRSGGHLVNWNATDNRGNKVGSGVYFYRLEVGNYSKTMKMVLMK